MRKPKQSVTTVFTLLVCATRFGSVKIKNAYGKTIQTQPIKVLILQKA